MEAHGDQRYGVPGLDGKDLETVVEDGLLDERLVSDIQSVLLNADLDGDLPVARRADEFDVVGINDGGVCGPAQLRIGQVEPKQGVCVEEKPHGT
jgi:hypothetical protein